MHYNRVMRHGSPEKLMRHRFATPEESFKARTDKVASGCIEWTGEVWKNGYGTINVPGGKATGAHRYAWERVNGPIPDGKVIDHICFNKRCVRVDHLRVVSYAENNQHFQGTASDNNSGYRGVSWSNPHKRYRARVTKDGKEFYAGLFKNPEDAGIAAALKRQELGFLLSDYDRKLISKAEIKAT